MRPGVLLPQQYKVEDELALDINDNSEHHVVKYDFELEEVPSGAGENDDQPMSESGLVLSIIQEPEVGFGEDGRVVGHGDNDSEAIHFQVEEKKPDEGMLALNWMPLSGEWECGSITISDIISDHPPNPVPDSPGKNDDANLKDLKEGEEISPAFSPMSEESEDAGGEEDFIGGLQEEEEDTPPVLDYYGAVVMGDDKLKSKSVEDFKCPFCLQMHLGREGLIDHLGNAHGLRLSNQEETTPEPVTSPIQIQTEEQLDKVTAPDPACDEGAGDTGEFDMPPPVSAQKTPTKKNPARSLHPKKCHHCRLSFSTPDYLTKHMEIHEETDRAWKCSKCPSYFNSFIQLRFHESRVHNMKRDTTWHPCKVCGKKFSPDYMKDHMLIHSEARPFQCPRCPYSCRQLVHLKVHLTGRHGIKKSIPELRSFLLQRSNLGDGVAVDPDEKGEPEPTSSREVDAQQRRKRGRPAGFIPRRNRGKKVGTKRITRKQPVTSKPPDNPLKCHRCKITFSSDKSLTRHMKVHSPGADRPWDCGQCYAFFKTSGSLALHNNQVHNRPQGDSLYPCPVCQKLFGRAKLAMHMQTHTPEDAFPCQICTLRFHDLIKVKSHMMAVHGRNWSASASAMSSESPAKYTAREEVAKHDGSSLVGVVHSYNSSGSKCPSGEVGGVTGNGTGCGGDTRAVRIPSGSGKNRCRICKKRFPNRVTMIVHMRIHKEEDPHGQDHSDDGEETSTSELEPPSLLQLQLPSGSGSRQVTPPTPANILLTPEEEHWRASGFPLQPCGLILTRCDNPIPNDTPSAGSSPASNNSHEMEGDKITSNLEPESFIQVVENQAGKTLIECKECGRTFPRKFKALRHVSGVHLKIQQYECPHCMRRFSYKENLERHLRQRHASTSRSTATVPKRHKCPKCTKIFVNRSNLRRHVIQVHKEGPPPNV